MRRNRNRIVAIYTRLFAEDVQALKKIANERGTKWQVELRLLVRNALQIQRSDIRVLEEKSEQ